MKNPAVFESVADTYDTDFTHTPLGQLLRQRVWRHLTTHFTPGHRILELACGTGEDAIWLARHGIQVTATGGSPEMVRLTAAKVAATGLSHQVTTHHLPLPPPVNQSDFSPLTQQPFDGLFSNFGGLNTRPAWRSLAHQLAQLVKPNGKVILVLMGPCCLWEIGWHIFRGQFANALRRFRQPAMAHIGPVTVPVWYPPSQRLRADFAPWFKHLYTESLGFWLPPPYLGHPVSRWPTLLARLNGLDQATARLTRDWGDHYIIVLERHPELIG